MEENQDLKGYYAFDSNEYFNFYVDHVFEKFKAFNICCKINGFLDIILLKIGCNELPEPNIFTYLNRSPEKSAQLKNNLDKLLSINSKDKNSIVKNTNFFAAVQKAYPGCSVITNYFLNSTFPTIFSNFAYEEYVGAAFDFINAFNDDPNSYLLVGHFLKYSYFFQEKLIDTFFGKISQSHVRLTFDSLVKIFKESFKISVPYMSNYQIATAKGLIITTKQSGRVSNAIFDIFLYRVFSLLNVSPKFTSEIRKKMPPKEEDFNKLYNEIRDKHKDFVYECFTKFNSDTFPLPKMNDLIFTKTNQIPITEVDINIISAICHDCLGSKVDIPHKTIKDFKETAFVMLKQEISFKTETNFFKPKIISFEMTPEKFEENLQCRKFIFGRSEGLYIFNKIFDSSKNAFQLYCRKFATLTFTRSSPSQRDEKIFFMLANLIIYQTIKEIKTEVKLKDHERLFRTHFKTPFDRNELDNLEDKVKCCAQDLAIKIGKGNNLKIDATFTEYFCNMVKEIKLTFE
ncbi:hypothetical protein GPJ56_006326 [Histomonas meleagridis]|uniref:uncharacterized protein n=1 Tax=Histomonas meleagridis TaxID=135588 RepID=UPI0035599149|nr:hypothetical protein GPJ56_006326 [Histomonas meleagridis]KAH0796858.1 hypothetical protein GO595_010751 [Histomonas meleagridis]